MRLLDKYLLSSIIKSSIGSTVVIVLVVSFFRFLEEISDIGTANYDFFNAFRYLFYIAPSIFNSMIPISILLGCVIVVGTLSSNKELQIFHSATVSPKEIITSTAKYSFVLAVLFSLFAEYLAPSSLLKANFIKDSAMGKHITNLNDTFVWIKKDKKYIFLNRARDIHNKQEFIIFDTDRTSLNKLINSNEIIFQNNSLIAKDVEITDFSSSNIGSRVSIEKYKDNSFEMKLIEDQVKALKRDLKAMSIIDIMDAIAISRNGKMSINHYIIEILNRIIRPLITVGMLLVAMPLVFNYSRSTSIGNRIFISIAVGVVSEMIVRASSALSKNFEIMNYLGPLLPALILISVGLVFIKRKFQIV